MISFDDIKQLFPVKILQGKDYKESLSAVLHSYVSILKEKKVPVEVIKSCKEINNQLLRIIDNIRRGAHSTAYSQLENILNDKNGKYHVKASDLLYDNDEFSFLYRMRKMDERRDVTCRDLFHIPFTMRDKVSTERFSFPGLPCLYLGYSVYVCWEEMGRPDFSRVMISAFKSNRRLKLLDLRAPVHRRWNQTKLESIPLLLACQVIVSNQEAKYKSEYIIPQLLMEYIIINNQDIDGIIYSSVYKDNQFNFPVDKYYNIAIPAIQTHKKENYSSKLLELFSVTDPTCEEYERLNRHIGVYDITEKLYRTTVTQNRNYEVSIFKEIENSLTNEDYFPLKKLTEVI